MTIGRTITKRFRNERGNDIYVRATEEPLLGVPGILLYVAGPDSDTEMHITREEARELSLLLSQILKQGR